MRQTNKYNKITPVEQVNYCASSLTPLKQVVCLQEIETLRINFATQEQALRLALTTLLVTTDTHDHE